METKQQELARTLEGMEVPALRRTDLGWLARNLAIRNANHPNFEQAIKLIKELRNR